MKTKNCHKDNISIHAGEDLHAISQACPLAKAGCMPRGLCELRSLIDFQNPSAAISHRVLNDTTMGGGSGCEIKYMADDAQSRFFGKLSYARNGGFCSVRSPPLPDGICHGTDGLLLMASSTDGQLYKVTLKTRAGVGVSASLWHVDFFPSADRAGLWRLNKLPFASFSPISKHQPWDPGGALNPSLIEEIGFMISRWKQDGTPNGLVQEGPFSLDVKNIRGYFTSLSPVVSEELRATSPRQSPLLAECLASLYPQPEQEDVEFL